MEIKVGDKFKNRTSGNECTILFVTERAVLYSTNISSNETPNIKEYFKPKIWFFDYYKPVPKTVWVNLYHSKVTGHVSVDNGKFADESSAKIESNTWGSSLKSMRIYLKSVPVELPQ